MPANDVDTTGSSPVEAPQGVIMAPDEGWMPSSPASGDGDLLDSSMPTVSQAPPETLGDVAGRILRLEEPPDELGPYWAAYSVKHDVVDPVWRWVADEPQLYLDADHNVRASSVHRDHSDEMAPMLGQAAVLLAPGANALASGESAAARARGVVAGEAGRFASLDGRRVVGDALTPHHMPQAALGFTSRAEGGP